MRFRGTLVRPLADQGDRDGTFIDPAGVKFEGFRYPVLVEFDYGRGAVGFATISRAEDGAIMADLDIDADSESVIGGDPPQLAAGLIIDRYDRYRLTPETATTGEDILDGVRGRVVTACRLNAVSLTAEHSDPGQPAIERVEE